MCKFSKISAAFENQKDDEKGILITPQISFYSGSLTTALEQQRHKPRFSQIRD